MRIHSVINRARLLGTILLASVICSAVPADAAILYGSTTQQASFAASTTQRVGELLDSVVMPAGTSSTTDNSGILSSIGNFFAGINNWLAEKAGIDFFGILTGIGHFFLIIIQFVIKLLRQVL